MANYNIVADTSNFKPISYEQMMAPINQVTKYILDQRAENDKINEAMADLQYAVQNSPEAKAAYDKYQNEFDNYASNFNDTPDGSILRNGLALRDRYFREIKPMEKAHEALKQVLDTRNKLAASGKRMVYTNPSLNLDMFTKGDYNETSADLDAITNRVAAKAQAYSKSILEDDDIKPILSGQKFQVNQTTGYKMSDLEKIMALMNDPEALSRLNKNSQEKLRAFGNIVNGEMNSIGINQYDANDQNKIKSAITDGLYAGLGETKRTYMENGNWESDYQKRQEARADRQENRQVADMKLDALQRGLIYDDKTHSFTPADGSSLEEWAAANSYSTYSGNNASSNGQMPYLSADGKSYVMLTPKREPDGKIAYYSGNTKIGDAKSIQSWNNKVAANAAKADSNYQNPIIADQQRLQQLSTPKEAGAGYTSIIVDDSGWVDPYADYMGESNDLLNYFNFGFANAGREWNNHAVKNSEDLSKSLAKHGVSLENAQELTASELRKNNPDYFNAVVNRLREDGSLYLDANATPEAMEALIDRYYHIYNISTRGNWKFSDNTQFYLETEDDHQARLARENKENSSNSSSASTAANNNIESTDSITQKRNGAALADSLLDMTTPKK